MITQRWPTSWLLTDERMGDALDAALMRALEAGAGIMLRHLRSTSEERRLLGKRVAALGAPLAVAHDVPLAMSLGAVLVHDPVGSLPPDLPWSRSVHDEREANAAAASSASLVFVSPVFPTRTHPGAPALGQARALALLKRSKKPGIALGGMDEAHGTELMQMGFAGWAGIDCWIRT